MGSLMSGWKSPAYDLKYERNKSLTKEEIDAFWRLKKIEEEELFFLKASYRLSKEDKKVICDESDTLAQRLVVKEEENMEPLLKKHGWWISSKWAFLNEPPKSSSQASYNYVAQFHVACKHIDNFNHHPATNGITA
uniref:Uncharacterized protein n=1 Tax=Tanacetum cinerariifolium TaxID=118510 RepID=A0A6L2JD30_TANCI|nr:hypothetical protein [Tanacetum cinerariifolium]